MHPTHDSNTHVENLVWKLVTMKQVINPRVMLCTSEKKKKNINMCYLKYHLMIFILLFTGMHIKRKYYVTIKKALRHAWVARRLSVCFSSGRDTGVLGSSPTSGSLHGNCFSLCLYLCPPLSVSLMNKLIKSFKNIKNKYKI